MNGAEAGSFSGNGDWGCEIKGHSCGIKKESIKIVDLNSNEQLTAEIEIEVRYLEPFMESEFGEYLIKGIPSYLSISNLAVTCPYVKLKVEGGETFKTGNGYYNVVPSRESEKVIITMNYNGMEYVKEFKTMDIPPPHIEFSDEVGVKCIELKPIGLFSDLKYTIKQIAGYSFSAQKEIQIKNEPCYAYDHDLLIKHIIYAIEEAKYVDTLILN